MARFRFTIIAALCFLLLCNLSFAQESKARIIGKITDDQGSGLPGVAIEAESPSLVGTATAISDATGAYRLLALTPGNYKITYVLTGFNTVIREGILIRVEETLTVDIELTPGAIEEEITVVGESPLIDVKSTSKGMTFSKEVFQTLPRGRDFDSLVTLIPGVNEEPMTGGLSVDGATGSENMYYIDGVDVTNIQGGEKGQTAAFEFVEEVQMKASGYQAEFGGSLGGVLNVITRSGGNEYHGELITYYSGSALTGKERDSLRLDLYDVFKAEYVNYQDLYGKDKVSRFEGGFNLGGFILKDRLWFFGSFLPVYRTTTRTVEWATDAAVPVEDFTEKRSWWNGSVKLTAQPIKDLRLSASMMSNMSKYRGDLPGREGTGNPEKEYEIYGFDYPNWSGNVSADYVVGNNLLISAAGGYFHRNTNNQQVQPSEPLWRFRKGTPGSYAYTTNSMFPDIPAEFVKPRGWANYGTGDAYVTAQNVRDRYMGNLNVTYYMNLAGEHAWKAGIQYTQVKHNVDRTYAYEYILLGWDRDYIDMFTGEQIRGKYGYYSVRGAQETADHAAHPYGTFANPKSIRWAIYLQDSWTPEFFDGRLTLNFGLRAETEDVPSYSTLPEYQDPPIDFGFGDKIAPRLGFVYDVFGNSNTKIFGSYGLYYDVMKLDLAEGMYGGFKWVSDYYTLDDYDYTKIGNGNYPGTYLGNYDWRAPAFEITDPEVKPFHQSEFSFGLEQRLREDLSASVRVVYKHVIRALECVGTIEPGVGEIYYITNPGYGFNEHISEGGKFADYLPDAPKARREYWAVNLNVDKRFSNHWLGGFSYTWSSLWGNYDGLRGWPNMGRHFDLWYMNWDKDNNEILGKLTTDRPHQFKFYGSYSFDFGLTVGLMANGMSGVPISRSFDTPVETQYLGRMSDGRTPFLFYANMYAEYNLSVTDDYRIQLSINIDNLFDIKTAQRKWTSIAQSAIVLSDQDRLAGWDPEDYDYLPDPRFLMEYDFYAPLEVRLGVKFMF